MNSANLSLRYSTSYSVVFFLISPFSIISWSSSHCFNSSDDKAGALFWMFYYSLFITLMRCLQKKSYNFWWFFEGLNLSNSYPRTWNSFAMFCFFFLFLQFFMIKSKMLTTVSNVSKQYCSSSFAVVSLLKRTYLSQRSSFLLSNCSKVSVASTVVNYVCSTILSSSIKYVNINNK